MSWNASVCVCHDRTSTMVGSACGEAALGGEVFPDHRQTVRFVMREWFQQQGIDKAEDGTVHSDAQREREHRHCGDRGESAETSDPMSQVLADLIEPPQPAGLSTLVSHSLDAAEVHPRATIRGLPRQACLHEVMGVGVHVEMQFFAECVLEPLAAGQVGDERPEASEHVRPRRASL
jgi:hypothetical protein